MGISYWMRFSTIMLSPSKLTYGMVWPKLSKNSLPLKKRKVQCLFGETLIIGHFMKPEHFRMLHGRQIIQKSSHLLVGLILRVLKVHHLLFQTLFQEGLHQHQVEGIRHAPAINDLANDDIECLNVHGFLFYSMSLLKNVRRAECCWRQSRCP